MNIEERYREHSSCHFTEQRRNALLAAVVSASLLSTSPAASAESIHSAKSIHEATPPKAILTKPAHTELSHDFLGTTDQNSAVETRTISTEDTSYVKNTTNSALQTLITTAAIKTESTKAPVNTKREYAKNNLAEDYNSAIASNPPSQALSSQAQPIQPLTSQEPELTPLLLINSSKQQTLLSSSVPTSAPLFRSIATDQVQPDRQATDQLELSQRELTRTEELAQTESANTSKFGEAGTQRWYLQAGAAADFDDDSFLLTGAGISHFFYDGHSANLELNGLSVSQPGEDALGATLTFLVRSHWIRGDNWSIYVDGGAGIIFTTGDVPEAGSSFNFTPQVGGGASFAINENQRIMTGLRWYHISNADTFESNPGLDTLFGYVGINFPL